MQPVREAWTDERLDDLALRMDKGFDRVDADLREIRRMMLLGFVSVIASVIATQL
jgi:hypothetical protein